MSADRMVGGASAQKNNAVPLRKNQRKSLENSCRNTKNRLANPGSGALPNHNRQESCASMGTTLVFNICENVCLEATAALDEKSAVAFPTEKSCNNINKTHACV